MASFRDLTTNFVKLDKFFGNEFRRWKNKMFFLLTTLKVAYVISTPNPSEKEDRLWKISVQGVSGITMISSVGVIFPMACLILFSMSIKTLNPLKRCGRY